MSLKKRISVVVTNPRFIRLVLGCATAFVIVYQTLFYLLFLNFLPSWLGRLLFDISFSLALPAYIIGLVLRVFYLWQMLRNTAISDWIRAMLGIALFYLPVVGMSLCYWLYAWPMRVPAWVWKKHVDSSLNWRCAQCDALNPQKRAQCWQCNAAVTIQPVSNHSPVLHKGLAKDLLIALLVVSIVIQVLLAVMGSGFAFMVFASADPQAFYQQIADNLEWLFKVGSVVTVLGVLLDLGCFFVLVRATARPVLVRVVLGCLLIYFPLIGQVVFLLLYVGNVLFPKW